jgi:hypothetical protein
VPLAYHN